MPGSFILLIISPFLPPDPQLTHSLSTAFRQLFAQLKCFKAVKRFWGQRLDIVPQHPIKHNILLIIGRLDNGKIVKKQGQVLQFVFRFQLQVMKLGPKVDKSVYVIQVKLAARYLVKSDWDLLKVSGIKM